MPLSIDRRYAQTDSEAIPAQADCSDCDGRRWIRAQLFPDQWRGLISAVARPDGGIFASHVQSRGVAFVDGDGGGAVHVPPAWAGEVHVRARLAAGYLLAGSSGFGLDGGAGDAQLRVVDDHRKSLAERTYHPGVFHDVAVMPGQSVAAVSWERVTNTTRVLTIDAYTWEATGEWILEPSLITLSSYPNIAVGPEGVVLVGYTGRTIPFSAGITHARTALIDPDFGVLWDIETHPEGMESSPISFVYTTAPSTYVSLSAASPSDASKQAELWAWQMDRDGTVVHARRIMSDFPCGQRALTSHDGRGAILLSWCVDPVTGQDPLVLAVDSWGNPLWRRRFGAGVQGETRPWEMLEDAVFQPNGDIILVGQHVVDEPHPEGVHSWAIRIDPWGRTCGMRHGVCRDLTWADCEDGNPCTINWCDPDLGCTHPPLPDGSPCGAALTCAGGECLP